MQAYPQPALTPDQILIVGVPSVGPCAGMHISTIADRQDLRLFVGDVRQMPRHHRRAMRKSIAEELRKALCAPQMTEAEQKDFVADLALLWAYDTAFGPDELASAGLHSIGLALDTHAHAPGDPTLLCMRSVAGSGLQF